MGKRDLDRIKRQILEDRQRLLDSMPGDKRLELERQEEIDIPQFMRDREKRINEARRRKNY
jgi:hypothetical protein